jgi:hypothetical protein
MKIRVFLKIALTGVVLSFAAVLVYQFVVKAYYEKAVLLKIIERLEADTRVAEVLVTGVNYDDQKKQTKTTIKFLEYDTLGNPLVPKYFTFSGNIIQFQSLVIRFDNIHIRQGDKLKGKSAYVFWKVFMLNGNQTEEYPITPIHEIPDGYRVEKEINIFEKTLWESFWLHAFDTNNQKNMGIKSAQIEAPGAMFLPGMLYTIKIEHGGGLRIDAAPLSPILKGETIK